MKRSLWVLAGTVALGAAGLVLWSKRPRDTEPLIEEDASGTATPTGSNATPRTAAMTAEERDRHGSVDDRGQTPAYALDVEELRSRGGLEPVVQYLTFIQSQRGEDSHLLFIRYEDIDAMAALEGAETPAFLERLDQLGVVVSNN